MTDYGLSAKSRPNPKVALAMVVGGVAFAVSAAAWDLISQHHTIAVASAAADVSAIVGPPCPVMSAAAFQDAVTLRGPMKYVVDFNGESFGRYFGDSDCDVTAARGSMGLGSYNVCQFTSPDIISVKTPRGQFYFQPGVGQKASILTPGGVPACVEAAPQED